MKNSTSSEHQKKRQSSWNNRLSYVGLPLAIRFSEVGFKVVGFDIDHRKVKMLNEGKSYIEHIPVDGISRMLDHGFLATTDFEKSLRLMRFSFVYQLL